MGRFRIFRILSKRKFNDRRRKSTEVYIDELNNLNPRILLSINELLKDIDSFNFNIFELNKLVEKKTIHYVLFEIFESFCYFDRHLDERRYKSFIYQISNGYNRDVPYHNDLHAADVLQTAFMFLIKGDLINVKHYLI
jgi:hypothetical protein